MKFLSCVSLAALFLVSGGRSADSQSFTIKKKRDLIGKPLRERYLDEIAALAKTIPGIHKQLAELQETLADELEGLIVDGIFWDHDELKVRMRAARDLKNYLELDLRRGLVDKASFLQEASKTKVAGSANTLAELTTRPKTS